MTLIFNLITEGITDQIVLERVLQGYFNTPDLEINPLQPLRDETDFNRAASSGGWTQVLAYCQSSDLENFLPFLHTPQQYLIIQLDTDVSERYGVSQQNEVGEGLNVTTLIEKVIRHLQELIDNFAPYADKILFAICVHSIECWLLPFYVDDMEQASSTDDCLEKLRAQLRTERGYGLRKKADIYRRVTQPIKYHPTLIQTYQRNPSLHHFVDQLSRCRVSFDKKKT